MYPSSCHFRDIINKAILYPCVFVITLEIRKGTVLCSIGKCVSYTVPSHTHHWSSSDNQQLWSGVQISAMSYFDSALLLRLQRSDQFLCCYSILIPLHALSSSRLPPSMSKGAPAWLWHVYFWEARRGSSLFRLPWTLLPSRPSSAPMFFHSKTSVMSKPVSNSCLASHRFPVSCSWITPAAVKSWVIPEI